MRRQPRYPYTLREWRHFTDGTYVTVDPEPPEVGYGMRVATYAHLTAHARCVHCGAAATDLAAHLRCGVETVKGKRRMLSARLVLTQDAGQVLDDLWFKARHSRWSYARKLRIESAAGSHARSEPRVLRELQEDRCFYCF